MSDFYLLAGPPTPADAARPQLIGPYPPGDQAATASWAQAKLERVATGPFRVVAIPAATAVDLIRDRLAARDEYGIDAEAALTRLAMPPDEFEIQYVERGDLDADHLAEIDREHAAEGIALFGLEDVDPTATAPDFPPER